MFFSLWFKESCLSSSDIRNNTFWLTFCLFRKTNFIYLFSSKPQKKSLRYRVLLRLVHKWQCSIFLHKTLIYTLNYKWKKNKSISLSSTTWCILGVILSLRFWDTQNTHNLQCYTHTCCLVSLGCFFLFRSFQIWHCAHCLYSGRKPVSCKKH